MKKKSEKILSFFLALVWLLIEASCTLWFGHSFCSLSWVCLHCMLSQAILAILPSQPNFKATNLILLVTWDTLLLSVVYLSLLDLLISLQWLVLMELSVSSWNLVSILLGLPQQLAFRIVKMLLVTLQAILHWDNSSLQLLLSRLIISTLMSVLVMFLVNLMPVCLLVVPAKMLGYTYSSLAFNQLMLWLLNTRF